MKRTLLLFLLFAGCTTQPVYKPVTVETPIPVPCRVPVVLHPVWPTESLSGRESFIDQIKAILAENELRRSYEIRLEAVLKACL